MLKEVSVINFKILLSKKDNTTIGSPYIHQLK